MNILINKEQLKLILENEIEVDETVGIPDNIYETAVDIGNKLFEELPRSINNILNKQYITINNIYNINNDYDISAVKFDVSFIEENSIKDYMLTKMSNQLTAYKHKLITNKKHLQTKYTSNYSIFNVVFLGIEIYKPKNKKDTPNELKNFLLKNKESIISIIAHELSHAYNFYKDQKQYTKNRIYYNLGSKRNGNGETTLDITPIRKFLNLFYYLSKDENLVRPTEIYADAREKNITQKTFHKYIINNDVFKTIKEAENFSYENLKNEINNTFNHINCMRIVTNHNPVNMNDFFIGILTLKKFNKLPLIMKTEEKMFKSFDDYLRAIIIQLTSLSEKEWKDVSNNILTTSLIEINRKYDNILKNYELYLLSIYKNVNQQEYMKHIGKIQNDIKKYKTPEEFYTKFGLIFKNISRDVKIKLGKVSSQLP